MAFTRNLLLGSTMIAGVAALTLSTPTLASAQTAQPPVADSENQDDGTRADEAADQAAARGATADTEVQELVVTGSRIRRSEFTSAAPVQVITTEQATLEGLVDTADLLQQSSVASGSFQTNNLLTGFVVDGGPGVETLSLRGLGASRTLILLNGRRVGPAGVRGTVGPVDLNTIPSSIIERAEILKDGASSIYGSDAVAGVVNIITKNDLDGGNIDIFGSASPDGGGEEYRISASYGKTFDRGFFNITADYYEQFALRTGDREDTSCAADYVFAPDPDGDGPGGGRVDYFDSSGSGFYKCYNLLNNTLRVNGFGGEFQYPGQTIGYPTNITDPGGANPRFPELIRAGRAGFPNSFPYLNYDSPLYQRVTVVSPVQRATVFATGGFDLTSSLELYGELLLNRRESQQDGARQLFPTLAADNPNNTYGAEALANGIGNGTAFPIIALQSDQSQTVDYARAVVGLRGQLPDLPVFGGWDWDVFTAYSRSEGEYDGQFIYDDRVIATTAFDVACDDETLNLSNFSCSALPAGGIPWLSERVVAGNFTPEERAFLFDSETGSTEYTQFIFEGFISGDLFTLPAGAVGAALGFHYRRDEIDDTPGTQALLNNYWNSTVAGRTAGKDAVREVFGELEIPLLRSLPAVDELTLQVSGRFSDYDSYGENSTYKVGLNWQITPEFRLRATQGTSYRAPALFELFLGGQTGFLGQTTIDPCIRYEESSNANLRANCAAAGLPQDDPTTEDIDEAYVGNGSSALIISGGGAGLLEAETSDAFTVGAIWTPEFIDLSVAVDYFEIEVNDEVTQFGSANILRQCYTSAQYPTDPFCSLFVRNTDPESEDFGKIETVNDNYVNVANQINRGLDLTTRYEHEFSFGNLIMDTQFTWQFEDVVTLLGGAAPDDNNGETTEPDFTGTVRTRFEVSDWTFAHTVNMIGKQSDTELDTYLTDVFPFTRYCADTSATTGANGAGDDCTVYFKQYNEFTAYHDFSVTYEMDDWTFQAGVINAFDERPPAQSNGQFRVGTAALALYDMVGRQGFVRIARSF